LKSTGEGGRWGEEGREEKRRESPGELGRTKADKQE
jgi:hypothetical protein